MPLSLSHLSWNHPKSLLSLCPFVPCQGTTPHPIWPPGDDSGPLSSSSASSLASGRELTNPANVLTRHAAKPRQLAAFVDKKTDSTDLRNYTTPRSSAYPTPHSHARFFTSPFTCDRRHAAYPPACATVSKWGRIPLGIRPLGVLGMRYPHPSQVRITMWE